MTLPSITILYNKPMPELPEVETIARGVDRRVRGDRIVQAWFASHPQPFKTPPALQSRGLAGRVILAVHRTGKHIVFELGAAGGAGDARGRKAPKRAETTTSAEAQWIVHLGMTGRLLVTTPESPVARHTHARLALESGLSCALSIRAASAGSNSAISGEARHSALQAPSRSPLARGNSPRSSVAGA